MRYPPRSGRRGRPRTSRALAALTVGVTASGSMLAVVASQEAGAAVAAAPVRAAAAARQAEKLDRGLVAVPTGSGVFLSWRLLGTDSPSTSFNVYRDSTRITSSPITGATNYRDSGGSASAKYTVRAVTNGSEQAASPPAIMFNSSGYKDIPISAPESGYTANDASVGDLDGDGVLEFVLKWYPDDAKDNSQSGTTHNTYLDGIKLDGTRMWRINLGRNIRSGAHYTQFQVFDYDGDGRAEIAAKTADGTVDGTNKTIGDGSKDYRNSSGYVLSGPEFLTMFDGKTGAAVSTVPYDPPRGDVGKWGDTYGNRVDRFLAGTAYLDGVHPSVIMARGYYTRTVLAAYDFKGGQLVHRWTFDSDKSGSQYAGQGNHQLSVADADGDGKDEIMYGSMAVDDNGAALWSNRTYHGDAFHVTDLIPSRPGLEVFKPSEHSDQPGNWLADAKTGQILWKTGPCCDNGRAVAADIWAGNPGAEAWSSGVSQLQDTATGKLIGRKPGSTNFLSWWDGDPVREIMDGTHIDKYGTGGDTRLLTGSDVHSNNGTKSTPNLSGDLFGDWREEAVWATSNDRALRMYTTTSMTDVRIPTLLHDIQYREAIAWQNTAYNQPPHPSFFIGDKMPAAPWPNIFVPGGDEPPPPVDDVVFADRFEEGKLEGWKGKGTAQKVSIVDGGAGGSKKALLVVSGKAIKSGPKRAVAAKQLEQGAWYSVTATVQVADGEKPVAFTVEPVQKAVGGDYYADRSTSKRWAKPTGSFKYNGGKVALQVVPQAVCDKDALPKSFKVDNVVLTKVDGAVSDPGPVDCDGNGGENPGGGDTGVIKGTGSGRCVDIPNSSTAPGTQAQLYDCNNGRNQLFEHTKAGELKVYGSMCLQTSGAAAVIGLCGGTGTTWTWTGSTLKQDSSGLCLDAEARGTANGTKVNVYTCNGGTNQQWTRG